jgi:hypothetical protein
MRIYQRFHFLSLDIVAGALASSCLASSLFESRPGWAWWLALPITVWLLYTGDHILDAWKHRKSSKRELHLFIFRNRRILLWFMGILGIVDLLLIFNFLDRSFISYGLTLAGLVLLFYAMRHIFRKNRVLFIPGEFFVLVLYMAGTWLGPLVTRGDQFTTLDGLVSIMFAGVLLMNLGIISLYDFQLDSRLGIKSMASTLGKKSTRSLMIVSAVIIYLMAILQFMVFGVDRYSPYVLILAGMATILLLILLLPSYFRNRDTFRIAADAVLLMGFLTLLIRV